MKGEDALFKHLFSDRHLFFELLSMFLPELVEGYSINEGDLHLEKTEFISSDLKVKVSDILYRIEKGTYRAYVYVLLEHQKKKDYLMPLRVLGYVVRIWEHHVRKERAKRL